ncbi:MAG: galactose mutarotase [Erysipelotrichaceae bacterium]|nr:galactose mutarotase [Erysipelotrichaceae bacterium]
MKKLNIILLLITLFFIAACSTGPDNKEEPVPEPVPADNDDVKYQRYILENEYLKAEISDLGATLIKFIDKKTGQDIVLGFDSEQEYIDNGYNLGASIGRNANRIGGAKFTLDGQEYILTENDHGNQLHGGNSNGFAFKKWDAVSVTNDEAVFRYLSVDGEEGFPGNLTATVTYKLDKNTLTWTYSGESDKDTILNMSNHSYFNLGDENIKSEYLYITTDRYAPVDEVGLTLDEVLSVKDTPFDFTEFTLIGDNLSKIENIDNNYVWEEIGEKLMAQLKNDKLLLSVYSDLPDMHVFTASHLRSETSKSGNSYNGFDGVALECQYFPNGINYGDKYLLPILRKGETMTHFIRYEVDPVN